MGRFCPLTTAEAGQWLDERMARASEYMQAPTTITFITQGKVAYSVRIYWVKAGPPHVQARG